MHIHFLTLPTIELYTCSNTTNPSGLRSLIHDQQELQSFALTALSDFYLEESWRRKEEIFSFNQHVAFLLLKCLLLFLYDALSQFAQGLCPSPFPRCYQSTPEYEYNPLPHAPVAGKLAISLSSTGELQVLAAVRKTVLSSTSQLSFVPSMQTLERRSHTGVRRPASPVVHCACTCSLQFDAGVQSSYTSRTLHFFCIPSSNLLPAQCVSGSLNSGDRYYRLETYLPGRFMCAPSPGLHESQEINLEFSSRVPEHSLMLSLMPLQWNRVCSDLNKHRFACREMPIGCIEKYYFGGNENTIHLIFFFICLCIQCNDD